MVFFSFSLFMILLMAARHSFFGPRPGIFYPLARVPGILFTWVAVDHPRKSFAPSWLILCGSESAWSHDCPRFI